jgi:hypothetical protein
VPISGLAMTRQPEIGPVDALADTLSHAKLGG